MSDLNITKGSLSDLDDERENNSAGSHGAQKEIKRNQSTTWASAALPGGEIPDIREELSILGKGIGSIRLSQKKDSVIVPTILPGFNRAIRTGGAPTSCMTLIHGPSKSGKTALCLGFARSFQLQGHFVVYVDAEHSLDKKFATECGVDDDQMELILPRTYEETTERVEKLINNFEEGRKKKRISKNRCLLLVVDSINKLVPEDELAKMAEVGKGYPLRALMNTVWLDRLTPIVASLPILFVALAHEKTKIDAKNFEKKYTVKGGVSLIYDSTVVVRVKNVGIKKRSINGVSSTVAQICEGTIEKNKVGIAADRFRFVMGQGRGGYPIGFDYCEQILEEAKLRGANSPIAKGSDNTWRHDLLPDGKIKGDAKFVDWLRKNPRVTNELIEELNETAIEAVVSEDSGDEEDED